MRYLSLRHAEGESAQGNPETTLLKRDHQCQQQQHQRQEPQRYLQDQEVKQQVPQPVQRQAHVGRETVRLDWGVDACRVHLHQHPSTHRTVKASNSDNRTDPHPKVPNRCSRAGQHRLFPSPRLLFFVAFLLAPSSLPSGPQVDCICNPDYGLEGPYVLQPYWGQVHGLWNLHRLELAARVGALSCTQWWRHRRQAALLLAEAINPVKERVEASPEFAHDSSATVVDNGGGGGGASWPISGLVPGSDKGSLLMRPSFDASLDWASNITAKGKEGCTLAKNASTAAFVPPRCPKPRRPVGIDDARRLGWRFAPLLHQHSLDWSRLSDPGLWLESAVLVDPVTYTTTDLKTYLENRHRARRAKIEKAAAEAAAAATGARGGRPQATSAETAASKAAAAAAEAAAEDPYWLIHEAYDTHNFFATRLVRRGHAPTPPKTPDLAAPRGRETQQQEQQQQQQPLFEASETNEAPNNTPTQSKKSSQPGEQATLKGRQTMGASGPGRRRQQQAWGSDPVVRIGDGGGANGDGKMMTEREQEQEDPFWPRFQALQGRDFFEAIAGDPLVGEEESKTEEYKMRPGIADKSERREVKEGADDVNDDGSDSRLGGKVYFTVFEPRLEHLHWTRPDRSAGRSPASDTGPSAAGFTSNTGEPTYAYVYTFWFFYPFNGCSNQLMATRFAGRHQAAEYFLCPLGIHEGDWEHLKVYVCQDGMLDEQEPAHAIAALQYSQHTWLPTYDCTENGAWTGTKGNWPGDCSFEKDPDHGYMRPRVYSGLHSHANSPHTSNLNVYAKVNFKQLLNFDGIYVADRFADGGPLFVPSSENTLWLPFPHEMGEAEGVSPEDIRPGGRLAWTSYMGNWGVPLTSPNFSITCLTHNLTSAGACDPRNPPVFILDRLLGGVGVRPMDMNWTPVLSPKRVAPELAEPISGPLVRRAAAYSWERELAAPLWDAHEPLPGLGGLSLATLARDTSSLACPLAEDGHRTPSWGPGHYLGNDPRVVHRLRLFVAAATAAIVAAAALSALVVKCMPLILAPHHRPHRHRDYNYDGDLYESSYHDMRRGRGGEAAHPPLLGLPQTFGLVYGRYDEALYEPQTDGTSHGAVVPSSPYQQHRGPAPMRRLELTERGAAADGVTGTGDIIGNESRSGGSRSSSGSSSFSEPYSGFTSVAESDIEPVSTASPQLPGLDGCRMPYDSPENSQSRNGRKVKSRQGTSTSGLPPNTQATTSKRFSDDDSVAGVTATAQVHHRCSEEQPLLASALNRSRRDGGSGCDGVIGAAGDDDDDDDDKPRRTVRRGGSIFYFRTASICPDVKLLPLLALRGCLVTCRCIWTALCCPCRRCFPGDATTDSGGGPTRRRRRRGLGPYLLGCATQPERRLLWLSLGIMAYSLGLIMSAQGLLETLHALRNLLLRGLWAIAGLEGVFVALLAAGGVAELALMVAAVSLGPKPQLLEHSSYHTRRVPPAAAVPLGVAASGEGEALEISGAGDGGGESALLLPGTSSATPALPPMPGSSAPVPPLQTKSGLSAAAAVAGAGAPLMAGSRPVSSGGAGPDWESYGIPQPHIHFPSTAAVAATAAAATAAATAAASAAASAAATAAAKVPWRTLALLAAVGYMEVAASLHLLGFGLALWVGVLGASEGCSAAVQGLYRIISFSPDVCLDLSVIGVPGPRCGGDLMQMCNVWRQLRLSGLLYGSLLIIAARLLLLIMATANYHSRHAVLLPLPQQQHHHHHHSHSSIHYHDRLTVHRQPPQNGGDGGGNDGGGSGRGWVEMVEVEGPGDGGSRRRTRVERKGVVAGVRRAAEAGDGEVGSNDGGSSGAVMAIHRREYGQETRRRSRRRTSGTLEAVGEPRLPGGADSSSEIRVGVRTRHTRSDSIPPRPGAANEPWGRGDEGGGCGNHGCGGGACSIMGGGVVELLGSSSSRVAVTVGSGILPVSTPARMVGSSPGSVVVEMGPMIGSQAAGGLMAAGGVGTPNGVGSDDGSGSSKGRRWGLFGL